MENNKSISHFSESDSEYDVVESLSTWEFIDLTDSDDDVTATSPPPLNYLMALNVHVVVVDDSTKLDSLGVATSPPLNYDYEDDYEDDYEEEDEEEEDLDDELVPMAVRGKFGKERIKKLGKRGGPRMNKAKKLAYIYNRPGCVRGLGVQHSYI